jgi:hypothetical protein
MHDHGDAVSDERDGGELVYVVPVVMAAANAETTQGTASVSN